ncbi:sigma-54-dependent transcriptional regulator [Chitinimonas koreensis]|uniref:sigma-54-dependent transcriptional regulator n=1 Tax=Chitinimonas koreensis TaxID=356302 RepID=UPI00040AD850|nr:sigma-54 dependent transcriptional regulator [Chitinimonas koreensis]
MADLLILDDDPDVAIAARLLLRRRFGEVAELADPRALSAALERHRPAVLLLDMNFSAGRADGGEGLALLRQLAGRPDAPGVATPAVIVMTAYADVALAVEAVKLGAFDFVTKPWDNAKLLATVAAALASRRPAAAGPASALLGESAPMRELRALIASVAPTEANVLILGENGVGKELVARALHQASHRADGVCLAVDMGALPESTFESELFGHRKGSFTDARSDRPGRFQAARGGTLFLDEIGNMPLANQAKLLTALERREVTPVGADRPEAIDVRIVSATNLDETQLFDPAHFRPDLLYRLNTIVLRVPPLRARRDDIALLAAHYLDHYARQYGKPARPLAAAADAALSAHDWPGNVRALRHACERAVILATGAQFEAADFGLGGPAANSAAPAGMATASASPSGYIGGPAALSLSERERDAIAAALAQASGNISQAAKLLGVSRAALYRKLEKHGL